MTAAVLDRPALGRAAAGRSGGAGEAPSLGGTLEALLNAALREAHTNGSTECPVCHARMSFTRAGAREAAASVAISAACDGCGSRLS